MRTDSTKPPPLVVRIRDAGDAPHQQRRLAPEFAERADVRRCQRRRRIVLGARRPDGCTAWLLLAGEASAIADCRVNGADMVGSWRVGESSSVGLYRLADCVAACRCCEACRFVSFSEEAHDCSWYRNCSLDKLQQPEGSHVTVSVAR